MIDTGEHMQTLVSVVISGERKMLGALLAAGTEASYSSVMGKQRCSAYREHLTYCHVTSTEQDKPVSLPGSKGEDQP